VPRISGGPHDSGLGALIKNLRERSLTGTGRRELHAGLDDAEIVEKLDRGPGELISQHQVHLLPDALWAHFLFQGFLNNYQVARTLL